MLRVNSCLADEKVPVQSTNIPYHLEQMLDILKDEEDDQTSGGTTVINKKYKSILNLLFKFEIQFINL